MTVPSLLQALAVPEMWTGQTPVMVALTMLVEQGQVEVDPTAVAAGRTAGVGG